MELFKILGTIAIDNDQANNSLDTTASKAESTSGKFASAMGKVGSAVLKAGAVVTTAAATATAALVKSSISAYAEYEQLVGGVETLFKDSSATVMEYADNAYKTAGLSANEYMDTITSFSASLLQSLGNDTAAAAEYGNLAVTDMSDNANKMGTSMESIQNAYQGFAKQNYTMLDNLKLGYGGTKEEMQRLIDDANALNAAQGKATDYSIESFADIVSAIHDVQTEMGITGTTALEASTTIQGSVASMKSAWQNFVTGLSDENADLGQLMDNLIDSAVTAGTNINTRLQVLLPRLTEGLTQLANNLIPMLPGIVNSVLPGLLEGATSLINGLVSVLPSLIETITPVIAEAAPTIIVTLATALISNLPLLLNSAIQIVLALVNGISQSLPQLIPVAVEAVGQLVIGLLSALPQVAMAALELAGGLLEGIYNTLIAGTGDVGPWIDETIVQPIRDWASNLLTVGAELADKLWEGIKSVATTLFPGLSAIFGSAATDAVAASGEATEAAVVQAQEGATQAAQAAATAVSTAAAEIPADTATPVSAMADIMTDDMSMTEAGIEAVDTTASDMKAAVSTAGFDNAGKAAMQKFIEGINSMSSSVMAAVDAIASAAVARIQAAIQQAQSIANSATSTAGSYATGLNYVPYDEFPAILHKGEAVLTASEAAAWRAGKEEGANINVSKLDSNAGTSNGVTVIQNISSVPQTPVEFAATTEAYFEQARWLMA